MGGYAAVILAGGAGRRLGGVDKPMLAVGGRPMLARVLDAVADAAVRIVVGPPTLSLPGGVIRASEEPPGGGPVAAAAAGLAALEAGAAGPGRRPAAAEGGQHPAAGPGQHPAAGEGGQEPAAEGGPEPGAADGDRWPTVALLAADLPFLDARAVRSLREAAEASTMDGVVFVDAEGRRQSLCGVWRTASLRAALDRIGPPAGVAVRALLSGLRVGELHLAAQPPPWYDCDQPDDLLRAEEWTHERP